MNKFKLLIIFSCVFALTGCFGEDEGNSDSPSETGRAIPDISVSCTSGVSAECDAVSDGDLAYLIWTSSTCADFVGDEIYAVNVRPLTCAGGVCSAGNSGSWLDIETDQPVTTIPTSALTAGVWLDVVDNVGSDSEPEAGDVFCCLDNQSSDASLGDAQCTEL